MLKQARLEQLLRSALSDKAKEIDASSGMWQNIKTGINTKEKKKFMSIKNFTWSKALAGATCTLILTLGLTLCFSAQAQVWAKDMVKSVTKIFDVVKTENGYKVVPTNQNDKSDSGKKIMLMINAPVPGSKEMVRIPLRFLSIIQDQQIVITNKPNPKNSTKYYSAAEAEAKIGIPVRLPGYLPEGYIFNYIMDRSKKIVSKSNSFAYAQYNTPDKKILSLIITNETKLTVDGGRIVPTVQISGKVVRWAEFPVITISNNNRESETITGHSLQWINNDIVYVLSDESGELSQEEMIKIALSIK